MFFGRGGVCRTVVAVSEVSRRAVSEAQIGSTKGVVGCKCSDVGCKKYGEDSNSNSNGASFQVKGE